MLLQNLRVHVRLGHVLSDRSNGKQIRQQEQPQGSLQTPTHTFTSAWGDIVTKLAVKNSKYTVRDRELFLR
jgi:flagellar hook-associated protein FlgK